MQNNFPHNHPALLAAKEALEYYAKNARSWISGNETRLAVNALAKLEELMGQGDQDVADLKRARELLSIYKGDRVHPNVNEAHALLDAAITTLEEAA